MSVAGAAASTAATPAPPTRHRTPHNTCHSVLTQPKPGCQVLSRTRRSLSQYRYNNTPRQCSHQLNTDQDAGACGSLHISAQQPVAGRSKPPARNNTTPASTPTACGARAEPRADRATLAILIWTPRTGTRGVGASPSVHAAGSACLPNYKPRLQTNGLLTTTGRRHQATSPSQRYQAPGSIPSCLPALLGHQQLNC
mmetsp:Transcript_27115/g.68945  ORF Transcript_27115/g.68945 Transcript_27115/m.68945 type:complete len:197 (-) Transcript_27115:343-933(-)